MADKRFEEFELKLADNLSARERGEAARALLE